MELIDIYREMKLKGFDIQDDMFEKWEQIYATSPDGLICYLISDGNTPDGHMLRYAPVYSFDRWSNSGCEIFFNSWEELYVHFADQLTIYKDCLKEISDDYCWLERDEGLD